MQAWRLPEQLNDLALDVAVGTPAQGAIFFRGATKWNALAAGASGFQLTAQGVGANPVWVAPATTLVGDVTLAPDTSVRNVVQPTGDFVPLTLKAAATQNSDLLAIVDNANAPIFTVTGPTATGGGTLQVGTADTTAFFAVTRTRTDLSGQSRGTLVNITATPAGNSSATFRGTMALLTTSGTVNFTGTNTGAFYGVTHAGSGSLTSMRSFQGTTSNSGGGAAATIYGCDILVQNAVVAATVTDAICYNASVSVAPSGAVITRGHGLQCSSPLIAAGAAITTNYGVRIRNQGNALITTSYAIDIDNQVNSTTPFSIRSQGGQCLFQAGTATVVPVTVQGAASQSADHFNVKNSANAVLLGVAPSGILTSLLSDATTNVITDQFIVDHTSSGTPAAGFGQGIRFKAKSSTTVSRNVGVIDGSWATATDASRKGTLCFWASDNVADRMFMQGGTSGAAATIGFLGTGPVVQQATASTAGIAAIRTDTLANAVTDIRVILAALRAVNVAFGLAANTA